MRYDLYLAAGYPIVSDVIEGACRHFIKAVRAGMRWTVEHCPAGAHLLGPEMDLPPFRIKRETERLYPHRNIIETTPWKMAA